MEIIFFDENSGFLDSFITHIRQLSVVLGNKEPQILEFFFRKTLSSRYYWVLFPIEDIWQAIETAKRLLTKEKVDRQLAGQSTSTLFMSIQEGYGNNKRTLLSFDTQAMLDNKVDKLTSMMSKLSAQGRNQNKLFKPKMSQGGKRGQGGNNYYDRGRKWDRFGSSSSDRYRRPNYRYRLQNGQS